ncbi:hypothetical protein FACS1894181_14100 [Bacteroidia bacterium]|nr:hypothetical protein FACS1894181_14100 [Bacteroidia bacterium]
MKTLNVSISDIEYSKFGIPGEQLNFTDFVELVSRELMRQNLNRCIALAEKHGLSTMTMEEITNEVKAVRLNAKNHR